MCIEATQPTPQNCYVSLKTGHCGRHWTGLEESVSNGEMAWHGGRAQRSPTQQSGFRPQFLNDMELPKDVQMMQGVVWLVNTVTAFGIGSYATLSYMAGHQLFTSFQYKIFLLFTSCTVQNVFYENIKCNLRILMTICCVTRLIIFQNIVQKYRSMEFYT